MATDNQKTIFLEPRECFDRCILGLSRGLSDLVPTVSYDYQHCVDAWATWQGVERWEAVRWLDRNLTELAVHPGSPRMVHVTDAAGVEQLIESWSQPLDL